MKKITFKIWDDEITNDVLAVVTRELPKTGAIVWNIPKFGHVAVCKKDYRKTDIYDIYLDHRFDNE